MKDRLETKLNVDYMCYYNNESKRSLQYMKRVNSLYLRQLMKMMLQLGTKQVHTGEITQI